MKIALVNQPMDDFAPGNQNSMAIWSKQVANELAETCQVTIYGKRMRSTVSVENRGPVEYRFLSAIPNQVLFSLDKYLSRLRNPERPIFASTLYGLEYISQVARDVRRQGYDAVHIHNFIQFAPVIRRLNPDVKIGIHMNCEWLSQLNYRQTAKRLETADLILACSRYVADKIRRRFPDLSNRCLTVPNGVDPDSFAIQGEPNNDSIRLLFVGRVSPEKGVHTLIEAFRTVVSRFPEAELEIVGPPGSLPISYIVSLDGDRDVADLAEFYKKPYLDHLQAQVPARLAGKVRFLGAVPYTRVRERYRRATLLVNPSYSEAFGMSLIEAMASGVPVVATRVGGMPEILGDGECGILVDRGKPDELAEAIVCLLDNSPKRKEMIQSGLFRVRQHYSWSQIAESIRYLYATPSRN